MLERSVLVVFSQARCLRYYEEHPHEQDARVTIRAIHLEQDAQGTMGKMSVLLYIEKYYKSYL
ncbi:hypothetical protein [Thermodesulfobium sp.]